jgi:DNA sulfur modification protein DndD
MKLKKMILHNFRQFHGKQEIDLETSEESNVVVIHGENGSGKTTILEAFSWCLYGKMDLTQSQNILNEKVFNDLPQGMSSDAKVVLLFEDRHKEYLITRSVQVKNVANKQYHTPQDQTFEIKRDGTIIDSPKTTIDKILSKELKKYFFFDGERIDKLAKPENAKDIEDGIKNIMGIAVYEKGIKHLKEAKKILADELKNIIPEGEVSPYEEEDKIITELDEYKIKLKNNIKRKEDKIIEKEKVSEELKSVEELEKHEKLKVEKENTLEEYNTAYQKLIEKEKSLISKEAYLAISSDLIFEMHGFLDEKREKGELPSGIREQFIQDLIDRGTCICGTSLVEGDVHVDHLKNLLNKTVKKSVEDGFLRLSAFTDKVSDVEKSFKEKLMELYEQKNTLLAKIEKVTAELSDITTEMKKKAEGSSSAELIAKRESIEETIEELTEKIGSYKGKIEELQSAHESIKRAIDQHQTQNRQVQIAEKRVELCQQAIYQMEDIYEQLTNKVREKLSDKVSKVFSAIVPGKYAKINHNFELEITKEVNGVMKKTPTSTGENQVASLAFISSLVNLAKEWDENGNSNVFTGAGTYPVVMDSPFGALDDTNRDLISKHVQSLAPQVIVFVSTSQWSKEVENNLKPYIQHEYILQYHNPNQEKFKTAQKSIVIDDVTYDLSVQGDYEFTKIVKVK